MLGDHVMASAHNSKSEQVCLRIMSEQLNTAHASWQGVESWLNVRSAND